MRQRKVGLHGQKQRLVRTLLRLGGRGRKIDLNVDGGQRRRHHEDDQQHQHHVDERRDVDLVIFDEIFAAASPAAE